MPENITLIKVLALLIVHLSIGYRSSRRHVAWFTPEGALYRAYDWEQAGNFYQSWFRVRLSHCVSTALGFGACGFPPRWALPRCRFALVSRVRPTPVCNHLSMGEGSTHGGLEAYTEASIA